jgi:hypothetical protein
MAIGLWPVHTVVSCDTACSKLIFSSPLQVGVYIPNAPPNYKEMVNQFDFFSGDIRHAEMTNKEQTLMRMQGPQHVVVFLREQGRQCGANDTHGGSMPADLLVASRCVRENPV